MRLFQVSGTIPAYSQRLRQITPTSATFAEQLAIFHGDGFEAVHTLAPVLDGDPTAFYTHSANEQMQRAWARENGLPAKTRLDDILLAQVEEHRPDVFYTMSTMRVDSALSRRLPGNVRAKIGWHAAPIVGNDMSDYLMVCNFPTLLTIYKDMGLRTAFFEPAHAPVFDAHAANGERDIDVLFIGTYSRWHKKRAELLKTVASLRDRTNIVYSLYQSRLNKLAETPLGWFGPLAKHVRPKSVKLIAQGPVFGRDYHALLARAKIVLNGAGDIGGDDRGNMRCWEALGTRKLMLSDEGNYPDGMVDGATIRTYRAPAEAIEIIERILKTPGELRQIADAGYDMTRTHYTKARQWTSLQKIVEDNF